MSRTAPFVYPAHPGVIETWLELGIRLPKRNQTLREVESDFLNAWLAISNRCEPGTLIDGEMLFAEIHRQTGKVSERSQLHAMKITLTGLCHAGIVVRHVINTGNRARAHEILSPAEVASRWRGEPDDSQMRESTTKRIPREEIRRTHGLLHKEGYLTDTAPPAGLQREPWTLHLISQLIERCSRDSTRQALDHLERAMWLDGERIEVEAARVRYQWEQGDEYGLIVADDAQLILAILTYAMEQIGHDLSQGREPRNRISLDILELSQRVSERGDERNTFRSFQKSMARIINTRFRFTLDPQGRLAKRISSGLGYAQGPRLAFNLVENVFEGPDDQEHEVLEDGWAPRSNMRYFHFSLNEAIWRGLIHGQGWMPHPELLYERRGVVHKVYHHLRNHATRHTPYVVTGENLVELLFQGDGGNRAQQRQRFCKVLWQAMHDIHYRGRLMAPKPGTQPAERTSLRFFDLDVWVSPDDGHVGGLLIEASHSEMTEELQRQQAARIATLQQQQAAINAGQPVLTGPAVPPRLPWY